MRAVRLIVCTAALLLVICNASGQPMHLGQKWPNVRPFSKIVIINWQAQKQLVSVNIPSQSGNPTYKLVCFSGNDSAAQEQAIVYSGGLVCALGELATPNAWLFGNRSLLSDGKTEAMFSRGNFNPEDIVGACSTYPEFGRNRSFHLRGLVVNLRLSDVKVSTSYAGGSDFRKMFNNLDRSGYPISRSVLTVSVKPDSASTSEYAAPVEVRDPKGNKQACLALSQSPAA